MSALKGVCFEEMSEQRPLVDKFTTKKIRLMDENNLGQKFGFQQPSQLFVLERRSSELRVQIRPF